MARQKPGNIKFSADKDIEISPDKHVDGRNIRVLLIEDSVHYQKLISMVLMQILPQAQLSIASDAVSGLIQYGGQQHDILILDILLPGIDGVGMLTSLQAHPELFNGHVIVVTSLSEDALRASTLAVRNIAIVHKADLVKQLPLFLKEWA